MSKEQTAFETVEMTDGRLVDFAGKRRLLKEASVNADGQVQVRLDFRNGETRLFTVPDGMITRFAAHGAEQKLGDATAGLDDVADMVLAVDELIDQLYNGQWAQKREGSGMAGTSILLRALVEVSGKPVETVKAFLSTKSHAEKIALRNTPKVKPVIDRLEAEKAARANGNGKAVDTGALLDELSA